MPVRLGRSPAPEEMVTIRPAPRAFIPGASACAHHIAASTLAAKIARQSSSRDLLDRAADLPAHAACRGDQPVDRAQGRGRRRADRRGAGPVAQVALVAGDTRGSRAALQPVAVDVDRRHPRPRVRQGAHDGRADPLRRTGDDEAPSRPGSGA